MIKVGEKIDKIIKYTKLEEGKLLDLIKQIASEKLQ